MAKSNRIIARLGYKKTPLTFKKVSTKTIRGRKGKRKSGSDSLFGMKATTIG